jgi:hypothetical protein
MSKQLQALALLAKLDAKVETLETLRQWCRDNGYTIDTRMWNNFALLSSRVHELQSAEQEYCYIHNI